MFLHKTTMQEPRPKANATNAAAVTVMVVIAVNAMVIAQNVVSALQIKTQTQHQVMKARILNLHRPSL